MSRIRCLSVLFSLLVALLCFALVNYSFGWRSTEDSRRLLGAGASALRPFSRCVAIDTRREVFVNIYNDKALRVRVTLSHVYVKGFDSLTGEPFSISSRSWACSAMSAREFRDKLRSVERQKAQLEAQRHEL